LRWHSARTANVQAEPSDSDAGRGRGRDSFLEAGTRLLDENLRAEDYAVNDSVLVIVVPMDPMINARIVLTTIGDKDAAQELANLLLERRLAACVNIVGPITSVYRWRDQVQNDPEFLLLIKTTAECAERLRSALKSLHPYELPECVELTITGGSEEYLAWLAAEVSGGT
jgi:periplasmic divalent cation tolerance protein